ncbi:MULTISPECIES: hypothetical protein [Thalassolituus]|jgi:D-glycerate 3-kinase|uniref:hypothetical protein n=1 Tax=Thalassolituus TaxID=187492 RepID=UPI00042DCE7C|nr:hypothetical protein [Thalassolituus oleivorans]AHK15617.1 hypothetical protein R615_07125 [Thalassolituus oleivorans R6-15]PCI49158.1 MAG: hypothetical protein COB43_06420 [Oceanospirillales bacterium]
MKTHENLWPAELAQDSEDLALLDQASVVLSNFPKTWLCQWQEVWLPLAGWLASKKRYAALPPIIGIHGGQGSGKSTLSLALAKIYKEAFNWNVAIVSIDDLYLTHAEREELAATVHPLLITRGVPGTHDYELGQTLFGKLRRLSAGHKVAIPAFDKVSDDRLPEDQWHQIEGPIDMILFEGWCVGCQAVPEQALEQPINDLEEKEDIGGHWRRWVNEQLKYHYHDWFNAIDTLVMLKVPDMQAVSRWRTQQEEENIRNRRGDGADRSLDEIALARFIQHYQRLTEEALSSLPSYADLVLTINHQHCVDSVIQTDGRLA